MRRLLVLAVAGALAGCGGGADRPDGAALEELRVSVVWPESGGEAVYRLDLPRPLGGSGGPPPPIVNVGGFELTGAGELDLSANNCADMGGEPDRALVEISDAGEWMLLEIRLRSSSDAFCHGLVEPGVTYTLTVS